MIGKTYKLPTGTFTWVRYQSAVFDLGSPIFASNPESQYVVSSPGDSIADTIAGLKQLYPDKTPTVLFSFNAPA